VDEVGAVDAVSVGARADAVSVGAVDGADGEVVVFVGPEAGRDETSVLEGRGRVGCVHDTSTVSRRVNFRPEDQNRQKMTYASSPPRHPRFRLQPTAPVAAAP
jgi:hypothetical protein